MLYPIKTAFRTLLKGGLYTLIHILGLTLGITACMLVATVVLDALSYDQQWSRSKDLYRMVSVRRDGTAFSEKNGAVYAGLAPELKHDFPEVEDYGELYTSPIHLKIHKESNNALTIDMLYADSAVMHLLDIDLLQKQDLTPTEDVKKIIVSQTFKDTYFPDTDPMGKRIYDVPRYEEKANEYLIAGVMKDLPANTHLRASVMLLQERKEKALNKEDWGMYVRHYILLRPGTDHQLFEKKVNQWYRDFTGKEKATQFQFQPIADVYLKSDFPAYQVIKGNIQHIYIFSGVALLLLLIACINYINLSTARAISRLKEAGVRKILGASRRDLVGQFLLESLLIFGIAAVASVLFYALYLPLTEQFIGHPLAVTLGTGWKYLLGTAIVILCVCLSTGIYPAWFISGFKAAGSVHGLLTASNRQGWLRRGLVVVQFAISIMILVSMLVVQQQVHFLKTKDVGFDTEGLISINHVSWDNKSDIFKHELEKIPDISSTSFSSWLPTDGAGYMVRPIADPRDPEKKTDLWYIAGEPNLAKTLGLKLKEGRYLQSSRPADAIEAANLDDESNATRPCLMTTSTTRLFEGMHLDQPINEAKILPVGIVDDFNSESLQNAILPTVIVGYQHPPYGALLIRAQRGTTQKTMHSIAAVWHKLYPEKLLDMQLVKETLASQYQAEEKLQALFSGFSLLTMLLAALGVFGLIVHTVSLRTKEIGIRKVLGASVPAIAALLSKDFVKLVLIAVVVASPAAWWAMDKWLEGFAYRIAIQWWVFAVAGLGAVLVALLTVGVQAVKAAMANPINSLRDE